MGWPYQQKPPMGWPLDYDSGLVPDAGFWPMLTGSGNTIQDLSGNGIVGTFVNDTSWVAGQNGYALNLDGNDDYIDLGSSLQFTSEDFTVIIKVTPFEEVYAVLIGNREFNVYGWGLEIQGGGNNRVVFYTTQSGAEQEILSVNDFFAANETSVFAVVRKGSVGSIYKNGVEAPSYVARPSLIDPVTPPVSTKIGVYFNGIDGDLLGQIEYVYVFNRSLSASEIAQLYAYPFCMYKDPAEVVIQSGISMAAYYYRRLLAGAA
ncbi:hypothetical protein LCGC14_1881050 [marine sediment metagenome]|uniref:LamG-like jellyroll fold domain-containing protein n=1 Tax=marine sediment metagenome TaxID=412755 RepID=A0A0F9J0Q7_9ZZZZ